MSFCFCNETATNENNTYRPPSSLHDVVPIFVKPGRSAPASRFRPPLRRSEAEGGIDEAQDEHPNDHEQEEHPELLRPGSAGELRIGLERQQHPLDRKCTRLNSSH